MTDPVVAVYRLGADGTEFVGYGTLVDSDFVLAHTITARSLLADLRGPDAVVRVRCWLDPGGLEALVVDATAVPSVITAAGPMVGITLDGTWSGDFSNVPLTSHDPVEEVATRALRRILEGERADPDRPPPGSPGVPAVGGEPEQPTDRPWWCKLCPTSARCR